MKVECRLQLHPNTVGDAKRRLLAARAQLRKGSSSPGAGTAVATASKAAPTQQRGGTVQYPHEGAMKLTAWVQGMCAHKLPVFKCTLVGVANSQINGTKWESNWPDDVTYDWYYLYLHKFNLSTGRHSRSRSAAPSGRCWPT